jgi:hypothetical protein
MSEQEGDLASLEQEERRLSAKRRWLQERMDFLRAGGGGFTEHTNQQLEQLRDVEKATSRQRRELHHRIDDMRAAAGLPSYRDVQAANRERLPHEA